MGGVAIENRFDKKSIGLVNQQLAFHVLDTVLKCGVLEFAVCPSARNAPLISVLVKVSEWNPGLIRIYQWPEERSAAFFALGRSRVSNKPVAVITTSGTAAGELLPAAMEAHYSGVPLLLITADRPRRFRLTGAPQSAEQVGIYGCYTEFAEDLAEEETSQLELWKQVRPAHLNVCFEEPLRIDVGEKSDFFMPKSISKPVSQPVHSDFEYAHSELKHFLKEAKHLFVVVGALAKEDQEPVKRFLLHLKVPVYLEAHSGLREDKELSFLKIKVSTGLFEAASQAGYPIDRVLRIGSVPTFRPWRDLEMRADIQVCSLSHLPFSGLSTGRLIHTSLKYFLENYSFSTQDCLSCYQNWLEADERAYRLLELRFLAEGSSEIALIHFLSKIIPSHSMVYLGNGLPIREWDLAATTESRYFDVYANRGVNGIDGQISTFLGLCQPGRENWAIIGDLTAIYDMAGLWILQQIPHIAVTLVIINNGGGQIFAPMFPEKIFLNSHNLRFKPLAEMWGMEYKCVSKISGSIEKSSKHTLIELIPQMDTLSQVNPSA